MSPLIPDNSYVVVIPWLKILPLKCGNIIKVNHARYGEIIKAVATVDNEGFIWLQGHHNSSVTREEMGPIRSSQVIGRVIYVFKAARCQS